MLFSISFVGAAIGRPAVSIYFFTSAFGEFVPWYCRDEQCSPLQTNFKPLAVIPSNGRSNTPFLQDLQICALIEGNPNNLGSAKEIALTSSASQYANATGIFYLPLANTFLTDELPEVFLLP